MKRSTSLCVALFVIILFPVCSMAEIYKWVNEEGVVHFTDDLNAVPLKYRPEPISKKPGSKKTETSSGQKDWDSMTYEEKVEYLRRLKEKKKAEEDRKGAGYPEPAQTETVKPFK